MEVPTAYKVEETDEFKRWFKGLKNNPVKPIISRRVYRFASGTEGDVEPVGAGVFEMRIHYGAGYRVYYKKMGYKILLLLLGGDKSTQEADIRKAKQLAKEYGVYYEKTD